MENSLQLKKNDRWFAHKNHPTAVKQKTAISDILQPKLTIGAANDKYEQ